MNGIIPFSGITFSQKNNFFFFSNKNSKQLSQPQTRIRQIKLFIELFLEQMPQRRQNIKKFDRKRCFALI